MSRILARLAEQSKTNYWSTLLQTLLQHCMQLCLCGGFWVDMKHTAIAVEGGRLSAVLLQAVEVAEHM